MGRDVDMVVKAVKGQRLPRPAQGGGGGLTTTADWSDNTWHHLAAVLNASTGKLYTYFDGALQDSVAESNSPGDAAPALYLAALSGSSAYSEADLDQVRLWNRALSTAELQGSMMELIAGSESGLVAAYRFDETAGDTLYDLSSNAHHGALVNMDPGTDWQASVAFNTWTGAIDADVSKAGNWSAGLPVAGQNIGISGSAANNPSLGGSLQVDNLYVASEATVSLESGLSVSGHLLVEGALDLNGQVITLGTNARLYESGRQITGTGYLTHTASYSNLSSENIAGLGAEITTVANLGSTTIRRYHEAVDIGEGNMGILRYFVISPTNNTELSATLVLHYADADMGGITEGLLELFKSSDNGSTWTDMNGTVDIEANTVSVSGLDGFSWWTAADPNRTFPVELLNVAATPRGEMVDLDWSTAREENSAYFAIERSADEETWTEMGQVEAAGYAEAETAYGWTDYAPIQGAAAYRLRQVDLDGHYRYSPVVRVSLGEALMRAYPNPVQDILNVEARGDWYAELVDAQGRLLRRSSGTDAGTLDLRALPAGLYYLRLQAAGQVQSLSIRKE
ncbi:MAG: T9SS C-terminal target domain-containing protein [Bacteroidetes bacterium]|nr:MAG: T9SS C-terminal target domain-containing protein [Bacteroidota bacterium]